jgi:hypothetical protein
MALLAMSTGRASRGSSPLESPQLVRSPDLREPPEWLAAATDGSSAKAVVRPEAQAQPAVWAVA